MIKVPLAAVDLPARFGDEIGADAFCGIAPILMPGAGRIYQRSADPIDLISGQGQGDGLGGHGVRCVVDPHRFAQIGGLHKGVVDSLPIGTRGSLYKELDRTECKE